MIKNLMTIGDGLGLVIDQPLLDLLKIDRDTPLEITTDGKGLYIRPVESVDGHTRFVESARRMMEVHAEAFRTLTE